MMQHLPTYCRASEMFTVNRVPNCAAVIRNLTFKFMSRLGLSSNALVCSIIDSDLKFVSRIRLHWMNMLCSLWWWMRVIRLTFVIEYELLG